MPEVNCSYINNMMRHYKTIDINVAVSIADGKCVPVPSRVGLITPLLKDVDKTGLMGINTQMKSLIVMCRCTDTLPRAKRQWSSCFKSWQILS